MVGMRSVEPSTVVARWLGVFNEALAAQDVQAVAALFTQDCYWRDIVALSWDVGWVHGRTEVAEVMLSDVADIDPKNFTVSGNNSAPVRVERLGREVIEAFHTFSTEYGLGKGVVRLVADDSSPVGVSAWTMLTTLSCLHGDQPAPAGVRPAGIGFDRTATTQTWAQRRAQRFAFADRDPDVLVVGGGHSGVMVAAELGQMGVDTLVIDRHPRVGDNWRRRYDFLALHNKTDVVHFPVLPFPDVFPEYLPKDRLAAWFEHYVEALDIPFWTSTEFVSARYDDHDRRWAVTVRVDGAEKQLRPRHIVQATGADAGTPNRPALPGLDSFTGPVLHTSQFRTGTDFTGQRVLIIGVGTSAHDVAYDMHRHGAEVTMAQRDSTTIVNLDSANIPFAEYSNGRPIEECDLLSAQDFTNPLLIQLCMNLTKKTNELDGELLQQLRAAGMQIDSGEDETGYVMKLHRYRGGYYINVGASELIANHHIGLMQYDDIDTFVPSGLKLHDGTLIDFDAVILATGYLNQQANVANYFGPDTAAKIGGIIGLDERGEYANTFRPTAQRALWFSGGGFASCRPYSRHLAIQIKAALNGTHPHYRTQQAQMPNPKPAVSATF
ncbi:NAD(P)/FAD-dependent oxidoreductase [Mycobacterium sp. AZCC_0083]|uniref:flavin-containing monooxygenase n=1 Tax=Mycobacterium sp. AZCC_0083 TaxID=2735882 RepID=UPI00160B78A9|nr:NAD(P)/FAD-dependent oxidoreductase [Mycobacterium sp. AZCC_0083]MBB5167546.1 putative flavoprotein involved in K+ transport [Mycobacterium sp. AZCC_0083]